MENEQLAIRIQAYLDGELSAEASEALKALCDQDKEARRLFDALKAEHAMLAEVGESDVPLPVPQAYLWQGIAKGIEGRSGQVGSGNEVSDSLSWPRWLAWVLPAGVGGCALWLFFMQVFMSDQDSSGSQSMRQARRAPSFHEVDSTQQNAGFISFRSDSEGVSVVWISNY